MTPEEKRYNEALERAKIAYKDEDRHLKATLDRIFPELKEDKGEKIRKAIINVIKSLKEQQCHHIYGVMYDEMIVWLEKQGRHANFRNKIQIGDKVTRNEDGVLVNLSQLNRVAKKNEKQGEQNPQGKTALEAINEEKADNANKVEPKDYSSIDPHFFKPADMVGPKFKVDDIIVNVHYRWNGKHRIREITDGKYIFDSGSYIGIKEQDSWELANKVEPKFHEGQWIVWQDKYYKVNYNGCGYELIDQNGASKSLEYGTIDETAHHWGVSDAKDGDVLIDTNENFPFIFKQLKPCDIKTVIKNPLAVLGYCGIGGAGFTKGEGWGDTANCTYYPATKEQRDILEKAMADAGYIFDFDKKELKKIKDEIEIPFGAKDSELQEVTYYIPKGFHAEIDDDKVVIKKGEKPIWSEEDEYRAEKLLGWLSTLINYIHDDAMVSLDLRRERIQQVEQIKTWLVSLKDRIQPKNDCNPYKDAVEYITKMCERYDKYSLSILKDLFNNVKAKCKDAKEFDSLHPQNTKAISQ
jgi:hypothetical protein